MAAEGRGTEETDVDVRRRFAWRMRAYGLIVVLFLVTVIAAAIVMMSATSSGVILVAVITALAAAGVFLMVGSRLMRCPACEAPILQRGHRRERCADCGARLR